MSSDLARRFGIHGELMIEHTGGPVGPMIESTRWSDRLSYAHDASHYLLVPDAVVKLTSIDEVAHLLRTCTASGRRLTFRSGGTSLSGQGQSDSLLVDTRQGFRKIEVLDNGERVRAQPGATVRQVNARLASHGFRLGPDPASEAACTIGGVVANNSSGMICGTEFNSYRTLESMVVVLPSGFVIDTSRVDADECLSRVEPELHAGLIRLRDRVRGNPQTVRDISRQFSLKNTMGYAVNAFIDFNAPVDILAHLMIGSEGTLGFIAEATFRTIPVLPHAVTGFLVFPNLEQATAALPGLVATGLAAIELLDARSLRVAQRDPASGKVLPDMVVDRQAALLVEFQEITGEALAERIAHASGLLGRLSLLMPAELTRSSTLRGELWHVRKGLYAAVAGSRPSGTTALLEDIAVPVPALADTCQSLVTMFDRHGYEESVIFGHAKDGNIHFLLNERFDQSAATARYTAFTDEMVDLVLGHGGTLKAEHGTGRIMAPFVRRQYGDELYEVMREVKAIFDPSGILNPGVVISDEDQIHVRSLKTTPTVDAEIDRCVECGYCEPVCPSRDLTLTPRQRIVLRRERQRAIESGQWELVRELDESSDYDLIDTCAADGMCATACPVLIDTGALVKRLRAERRMPIRKAMWSTASHAWGGATVVAAHALNAASTMPHAARGISRIARVVGGQDNIPAWDHSLPAGGKQRVARAESSPFAVYLPSCVNTMFGAEPGMLGVQGALIELCDRAGISLRIPEGIASTCCGTPFKSKGMTRGHRRMQARMSQWLWTSTEQGRLPVVSDATSCVEGIEETIDEVERTRGSRITVLDAVQFAADTLLPRIEVLTVLPTLALHPTCSSTRLGLNGALMTVARAVAAEVSIPDDWGCCGFAGDRGLLHPELTESATASQGNWVRDRDFSAHASSNRTCEIAMTRATGRPYRHILEILADSIRAVETNDLTTTTSDGKSSS